eukprot:5706504-Pyramimonas_sp.AAC.1
MLAILDVWPTTEGLHGSLGRLPRTPRSRLPPSRTLRFGPVVSGIGFRATEGEVSSYRKQRAVPCR